MTVAIYSDSPNTLVTEYIATVDYFCLLGEIVFLFKTPKTDRVWQVSPKKKFFRNTDILFTMEINVLYAYVIILETEILGGRSVI